MKTWKSVIFYGFCKNWKEFELKIVLFCRWSHFVMCSCATPMLELFCVLCQSTLYRTGWLSSTCGCLLPVKWIMLSIAAVTQLVVTTAAVVMITLLSPSSSPFLMIQQVMFLLMLTAPQKSGLETLLFMSLMIHTSPWRHVQRYVASTNCYTLLFRSDLKYYSNWCNNIFI